MVLHNLMPAWSRSTWEYKAQLPGGYAHVNVRLEYRGEDFALRLPDRSLDAAALQFEGDWLAKLPAGIGADVVAFDVHTGALLTRWIDAPLLVDFSASPSQLVAYLVGLHNTLPPAGRSHDLARRIDSWLGGSDHPAHIVRARAVLDSPLFALSTCHNDLNPWNVLCTSEGFRTLDWEWVGDNDPLFDLATLAFGIGLSDEQFAEMASAYAGLRKLPRLPDQQQVSRVIQAFWLREYAWATAARKHGNTRAEVEVQRLTALERLKTFS